VIVAGLSMGGYVAFALWRRHQSGERLALVDTRAEPTAHSRDAQCGRGTRTADRRDSLRG